jgi:hypothetical protein
MPSFQGSSISRNGDRIFGAPARSILERQGSSLDDPALTQLTEPNDYGAKPLRVSNNTGKPFESPFKDLSVTSFRSALDLARADSALISPLSAAPHEARIPLPNGSPLSHRRLPAANYDVQGSLVPPPPPPGHLFKSSQSPNSELAEILEFEQRKKVAILHQRRPQPNHAHDELCPAKLAHLQRKSNDTTSVQAISSQTREDLLSLHLSGDGTNPACGFERRFAKSSDKKARGVPHRNSPYLNRYLAAKERLDHARPESGHPRETNHSDSGNSGASDVIHEADVRLPEDDPRAYLVRQYGSGKDLNCGTGLTKAGLKIRRV